MFSSIYVGYGLKKGGDSFSPIAPPSINADPEEKPEQPEPTPLTDEQPAAEAPPAEDE
jgi:hypothetical protein